MKTDERIRCRKCLLEDTDDKSLYEKIKRTDDKEYRRRLELCRQCDKLLAGMCRVCGCFVEILAANRNGFCPGEKHVW